MHRFGLTWTHLHLQHAHLIILKNDAMVARRCLYSVEIISAVELWRKCQNKRDQG
jgi:hypothetical protein